MQTITSISAAALAPLSLQTAVLPVSLRMVLKSSQLLVHSNPFKQPSSEVQHNVAPPNKLIYKGHEDRKNKQCTPYKELTACAKTWWDP